VELELVRHRQSLEQADLGRRPVERCDLLGKAPYSEKENLLDRPYLSNAHRHSLEMITTWMRDAGMSVRLDAMGNLVGRYEGASANAPALLIGSHIDSVSDAGRYDGALGVMLGIECIDVLAKEGVRLPLAIEVIAFGDEEGSRFAASMMCSQAVARGVDPAALDTRDKNGTTLRQALRDFGLDPEKVGNAKRSPKDILAYVEAHIEQGPVLEGEELAVGVVTGIAAQLRVTARFKGEAGHAGTIPMRLRRDALAAAAAGVLAIESICKAGPGDLVGTVGGLRTSTVAFNVIAAEAEISIDLRASSQTVRDAAMTEIGKTLEKIAGERNVELTLSILQDLPGCQFDGKLMQLMDGAVQSIGIRPYRLVSGAGHDAMSIAGLAPVAMLFVRCDQGVSHNAAENVRASDVDAAVRTLVQFVKRAGQELS
jgi:allantoate deiminase